MTAGKNVVSVVSTLLVATIWLGCGGSPPPVSQTVTNQALGIRIASLPSDFSVAVNEGDQLELVPSATGVEGRVRITVHPEETGVNLVAAVKGHQRRIEESEGSDYMGGQELISPLGTAFYSRGRYLAGINEIEETVVFVGHPSESRLLTISYSYPAGVDSSVRVQQALDLLGEVEALDASAGG